MTDDIARSLISRGKILSATRAARLILQVQLLNGEVVDRVECLQPYGYSALPLPGADVLLLTVGGIRDDKSIIAVDLPNIRIRDLASGELGLSDGATVFACRFTGAEISTPGTLAMQSDGTATIVAPLLLLQAFGATVEKLVDARFIALFNAHTHPVPGGTSGPPNQTMGVGSHTTTTTQAS